MCYYYLVVNKYVLNTLPKVRVSLFFNLQWGKENKLENLSFFVLQPTPQSLTSPELSGKNLGPKKNLSPKKNMDPEKNLGPNFFHFSNIGVKIRLNAENKLPRCLEVILTVCVGGGGLVV